LDPQPPPQRLLGFSAYEWLVIAAGWAGWGFDVFDAVLFNFVAPNCIPTLLHLPPGTPAAHQAVVFWTGAITSVLLLSWAAGGVGSAGSAIGSGASARCSQRSRSTRSAPGFVPSSATSGS